MWTKTHSKTYKDVSREEIWKLWVDVNRWSDWHEDLDYCKLEEPFAVGNTFILKPKGAKPVQILLTDIEEGFRFTDCTAFPGAKMYDTHEIAETKDGILLTNTIKVTGPLSFVWTKLVAKNVAATVLQDMDALVNLARGNGR